MKNEKFNQLPYSKSDPDGKSFSLYYSDLARKLDPMIGDYEYRSYNPETKEYENGYVPLGPIDFWDKETQVPNWLDKGKYWNILLGLQTGNKEIILQVVRDRELPFTTGRQN